MSQLPSPKVTTTQPVTADPDSLDSPPDGTEDSIEGVEPSTLPPDPEIPWWIGLLPKLARHRIALVLCSSGLFVVPVATKFFPYPANLPQPPTHQQLVSLVDYERLEIGMTLTDAQATLGRAIEVSRDETTATYQWVNSDGSEITAVFKDNRLIRKDQSGLR